MLKVLFKQYKWLILLLFTYFGIVLYCSPLDITILGAGDKCFTHLYSAATGQGLYNSSIYMMFSWIIARLPFSTGFSLSFFLSIIPSIICIALVYFAVKKQTDTKGAPLFASLSLAGSWVFLIQALKVDVYPIVAMFLILGYTLAVYKKGTLAAISFGFALASHWVDAIPAVVAILIYNKEFRRKSYWCVIVYVIIAIIWRFVPVYKDGAYNAGIMSSFYILTGWWGSGSFNDLIGNLSRIPIIMFMIGFGWIPATLYSIKEYKKAAPLIFIVGVLLIFIIVAPSDAGSQQMGAIIPFLAVAAGLGLKYIKFKNIIVFGSIATLFITPIFWNIDTNPTSARDMINQLDNVPDNSIVLAYREPIAYSNAIMWIVDYYNYENDKHIYPLSIGIFNKQSEFADKIQEVKDMGIIIPDEDTICVGNVSQSSLNIINALVDANPNISFYYYECVDFRSLKCELKLWE